MSIYKGMIRLKTVDLSNWAANHGLFDDAKSSDPIRYGTEGMDTINVYVEKTDSMEKLQDELAAAMDDAISKFSGMDNDYDELAIGVKAVLDAKVMKQSFSMQCRLPISPYIEVVIKVVE